MLENLPVLKRDEIDVEGIDLTRYRKIGEEITEVVEFEPGKLYRHQYVRFKYGLIDPTEPMESDRCKSENNRYYEKAPLVCSCFYGRIKCYGFNLCGGCDGHLHYNDLKVQNCLCEL